MTTIERANLIAKLLEETNIEDRVLKLRIMAVSEQVRSLILDLEMEETSKANNSEITPI